MKKFYLTRKFLALQREWNEKLLASGFVDAEKLIDGDFVLKQFAKNSYRQCHSIAREAKLRYYELLSSFNEEYEFNDPIEKLIMARRSQGISIKEISEELRDLNARCHRQTIRTIIRKYEIKWGLRKKS